MLVNANDSSYSHQSTWDTSHKRRYRDIFVQGVVVRWVWMRLCADAQDAGIVSGYLSGLVGLRATSKFSQEGVGWPLESIVGVQAFETAERERADGVLL